MADDAAPTTPPGTPARLTLLHGTSSTFVPQIRTHGLRRPHLTDDPDLAAYYADAACDEHHGQPALLTVTVDARWLRYDRAAMTEPVLTGTARRDQAWTQAEAQHPEWMSGPYLHCPDSAWQISLAGAASVRCEATVAPTDIATAAKS